MRPLRNFLPLLLILLAVNGIAFAQSADEKRLAIAKDVMDDIAQDRLAAVRERFSPDLREDFSENDLKGVRDALLEVAGAFQSHISQSTRTMQGMPVYVAKSQFEHYKVELKLMFDDADLITNFRIAPLSDLTPESMEASARAIAMLLGKQEFDEVNARFNDKMKDAMPTGRLGASWMHVMMHLGTFKSIRTVRKDPEFDRVDVRCEFENGPMIVRVAFDPAGKVEGLWMLPAETEKDSQA